METLIADEVLANGATYPREAVIASLKGISDAVPDYHWTIEDLFTDENRIAARLQDTGTPVKPFLGQQQPTGASLNIMEYGSYRVENGQFVEMWFLMDSATAAAQLQAGTVTQVSA